MIQVSSDLGCVFFYFFVDAKHLLRQAHNSLANSIMNMQQTASYFKSAPPIGKESKNTTEYDLHASMEFPARKKWAAAVLKLSATSRNYSFITLETDK